MYPHSDQNSRAGMIIFHRLYRQETKNKLEFTQLLNINFCRAGLVKKLMYIIILFYFFLLHSVSIEYIFKCVLLRRRKKERPFFIKFLLQQFIR